MTFLIWLFVLALLISTLVILYKLRYFFGCAFLIAVVIALASGWVGVHAAGSIDFYLFPYFYYGADKVRSENIRVVDYHGNKYILSNGDAISSDKQGLALKLIMKVTFVIVGGMVMLPAYAIVLRLTKKSFPDLYKGLARFSRSRFSRQKNPQQP